MTNTFREAEITQPMAVSRGKNLCSQSRSVRGMLLNGSAVMLPSSPGPFVLALRELGALVAAIPLLMMLMGVNVANASEPDQYDLGSSPSISGDEYSIGSNDVSIDDITFQEDGTVVWPSKGPRLINGTRVSNERDSVNPDVLVIKNRKAKSLKPASNDIVCRQCDHLK